MKSPLLETSNLGVSTPNGRVLIEDLNMCLSAEQVAIVGRNGVGKSTLLEHLSGRSVPKQGRVTLRTDPHFVPQLPEGTSQGISHGEACRAHLERAHLSGAELLLLDEPSQHLDQEGIVWLQSWLRTWKQGLLVVSHDPQILQCFRHFFLISETGCRSFSGTFVELEEELESEAQSAQKRYLRNLHRMIEKEEHILHVTRRRARKRQYGRCRELDRATPRTTLNQKRDYAQVKHGRMKKEREAKLNAIREWTKNTRRGLQVELPLLLPHRKTEKTDDDPVLELVGVSARTENRVLFEDINLVIRREKYALTGPNGAGKTTLLEIVLGHRVPESGRAKRTSKKIGYIAQGGRNWMLEESLLEQVPAERLLAHKFPLALAERPLRSLSPGERVRAALICLFHQTPMLEVLILDEPTYSLDLGGRRALTDALRVWPERSLDQIHNGALNYREPTAQLPLMDRKEFVASLKSKGVPSEIIDSLELVTVDYHGFESEASGGLSTPGRPRKGQLALHKDVAASAATVFERLFEETDFPTTSIVPVSQFGWSDQTSVKYNNSSGFNRVDARFSPLNTNKP